MRRNTTLCSNRPFLAKVVRDVTKASIWKDDDYRAGNVQHCSQLPLNTVVIVLPLKVEDMGWAAIVCNDPLTQSASFAWMHPQGLRSIAPGPQICIKHCGMKRSRNPDFVKTDFTLVDGYDGGTVYNKNTHKPALDCRFAERYDQGRCNGWCVSLVEKLIQRDLSKVLEFLQAIVDDGVRDYDVFCERACHRSVAVANFLHMFAGCSIQHGDASRLRNCCRRLPASESLHTLCDLLRELPLLEKYKLSQILDLPQ